MTTLGDYLTEDIHEACGYWVPLPATAHAWAVEAQLGPKRGEQFWTTVLIAHRPSTYRTLEEARKKASYLRSFYKKNYVNPPEVRIIKITFSRELVA